MGIYLDYNASTPIDERVLAYMMDIYRNHYGNADSRTHRFGSEAKNIVERSRQQVADLLKAPKEAVYFTSGSTESNNMAVLGLESHGNLTGRKHIITTAMEHKSVLEPCRVLAQRGFEVEYVRPHEDGRVWAEDILERVREDTLLVSVMHVNNETGSIQPVKEIGNALRERNTYFHIDASQSCGKLVREIWELPCDLLSFSAHKMYGPQGVGGLIIRSEKGCLADIKPILYGGGQERGMRPGTLPVALIGGLGEAARILLEEYQENEEKYKRNKEMILNVLRNSGVQYQINGDLQYCVDTTLNVSFADYDSEALMLALQDIAGISNGSACTSHSYAPSYVLQSMGFEKKRIETAVRISWGKSVVDRGEIKKMVDVIKAWQI